MKSKLVCVGCGREYLLLSGASRCECGDLLEVVHDLSQITLSKWICLAGSRLGARTLPNASGVWRYREAVLPDLPDEKIISRGEGNTRLYEFPVLTGMVGVKYLRFKHEGENPTGSFKDRGMTAAVSWAKHLGSRAFVAASTGNTAASAASYGRAAGIPVVVLIPEGRVAQGKISQALAYGAKVVKVRGNFDDAMRLVSKHASDLGLHVLNSINPVRLEGQKTIIWEMLEQRGWRPPNWIIVPGGNLGNTAAFGKALREMVEVGVIRANEVPRLAVIQASGASPFYSSWKASFSKKIVGSSGTIASAIDIGDPVNYSKARKAIEFTNGLVDCATDDEIMEAKALLDREGVGAEPASCATLAGLLKLSRRGAVQPSESVVCVLTGHFLKDQSATLNFHERSGSVLVNKTVTIDPTLDALERVL